MSIVLFAMIGAMLRASNVYWLAWLIYSMFRILKVISDASKR